MEIFDYDEDMWIYSKLNFIDILQNKKVRNQKRIIKKWIKENIEKIGSSGNIVETIQNATFF